MSTPLLCVLYELCLPTSVICVWLHRTRRNKSYVVIPLLILNPLFPFYSLSTCGLKSGSLFQFPPYFFFCASALRVSKCVILFFIFPDQKLNIKIYTSRTTKLPVVLYGCETWSLTLREERRLRVFENRVLKRVFGPIYYILW